MNPTTSYLDQLRYQTRSMAVQTLATPGFMTAIDYDVTKLLEAAAKLEAYMLDGIEVFSISGLEGATTYQISTTEN